ncbi:MAG: HD domain-containing protein, partial [Caldilineaceae bacterium]
MSSVERAVAIAIEAHAGQLDKSGKAYIAHPLRVMAAFAHEPGAEGEALRMVAVLHDVVEDAPAWPLERLRGEGFLPEIIDAVDHLTRRESESYEAFVDRALAHPLARRVKLADLRDNMDLTRLLDIDEKT